jgi:hypothetical protein
MARRQSRDPLERLDTPAFMTRALVQHMPAIAKHYVVEPCAGAGAIVDVLNAAGTRTMAFDTEPRADHVMRGDTIAWTDWTTLGTVYKPTALITNPPFSLGAEYWRLGRAFDVTALLVRLTWLEVTRDRADIADPDALVIMPRSPFTGPGAVAADGTPLVGVDSVTVCWAIWAKDKAVLPAKPITRLSRADKAALSAEAA